MRVLTTAVVLLLAAACGGGDDGGDGDGDGDGDVDPTTCVDEATVIANVIEPAGCGRSGCHGGASPTRGLDLGSADLEGRLIESEGTSTCGSQIYIVAGDADASLLADKIKASPPCGSRMPIGGTLSANQVACVETWINGL